MKTVKMDTLKRGDIFTFALKVKGCEAFHVLRREKNKIYCYSRNDPSKKEIKKIAKPNENVLLMRRETVDESSKINNGLF